jgi:hypothetical protein
VRGMLTTFDMMIAMPGRLPRRGAFLLDNPSIVGRPATGRVTRPELLTSYSSAWLGSSNAGQHMDGGDGHTLPEQNAGGCDNVNINVCMQYLYVALDVASLEARVACVMQQESTAELAAAIRSHRHGWIAGRLEAQNRIGRGNA